MKKHATKRHSDSSIPRTARSTSSGGPSPKPKVSATQKKPKDKGRLFGTLRSLVSPRADARDEIQALQRSLVNLSVERDTAARDRDQQAEKADELEARAHSLQRKSREQGEQARAAILSAQELRKQVAVLEQRVQRADITELGLRQKVAALETHVEQLNAVNKETRRDVEALLDENAGVLGQNDALREKVHALEKEELETVVAAVADAQALREQLVHSQKRVKELEAQKADTKTREEERDSRLHATIQQTTREDKQDAEHYRVPPRDEGTDPRLRAVLQKVAELAEPESRKERPDVRIDYHSLLREGDGDSRLRAALLKVAELESHKEQADGQIDCYRVRLGEALDANSQLRAENNSLKDASFARRLSSMELRQRLHPTDSRLLGLALQTDSSRWATRVFDLPDGKQRPHKWQLVLVELNGTAVLRLFKWSGARDTCISACYELFDTHFILDVGLFPGRAGCHVDLPLMPCKEFAAKASGLRSVDLLVSIVVHDMD